jgi:hypothetical protein
MSNHCQLTLTPSVSSYTHRHVAYAFSKTYKRPDIRQINVPVDTRKMKPTIRQIATCKIYNEYANIPGIGPTIKAIVRVMIFAEKVNDKKMKTVDLDTKLVITELKKQLGELQEKKINGHIVSDTDFNTKKIMLDKLEKENNMTNDVYKLSGIQITAIARKVYNILKKSSNGSKSLYQEFEMLTKPVYDHEKESSGGDYKLKNTSREMKFKASDKWRNPNSNNLNLNNTIINKNLSKSKYIPPALTSANKNSSNNNKLPVNYVPPYLRKGDNDIYSKEKKQTNQRVYIPPVEHNINSINNNTHSSFVSINDIKNNVDIESIISFPELSTQITNKVSTVEKSQSHLITDNIQNTFNILDNWSDTDEDQDPIPVKPKTGWIGKSFANVLKEAPLKKVTEQEPSSVPITQTEQLNTKHQVIPIIVPKTKNKQNILCLDDGIVDDDELYNDWGDTNETYYDDDYVQNDTDADTYDDTSDDW